MKSKTLTYKMIFAVLSILLLNSCGGGGSSSGDKVEVVNNVLDTNDSWATYSVKNIVNVPDKGLKKAMLLSLGLSENNEVTSTDLEKLVTLYASNMNITDLSGIEYATSLETVYLQNNYILNVEPLSKLTSIKTLNIDNNRPIINRMRSLNDPNLDLSPLSALRNLKNFSASGCQLDDTDINQIAKMGATRINVSNNQIQNFPMGSFANGAAATVIANNNEITDIQNDTTNNSLTKIELSGNKIQKIDSLLNLKGLKSLAIEGNQVQSPTALTTLNNLEELSINGNGIHPNDAQITSKKSGNLQTMKYVGENNRDCTNTKTDLFHLLSTSAQKCLNYGSFIDANKNSLVLTDYTQESLCKVREIHCAYEMTADDRSYFPRAFVINNMKSQIRSVEIIGKSELLDVSKAKFQALAHYTNGDVEDISSSVDWNTTAGVIDNEPYMQTKIDLGYEGSDNFTHQDTVLNENRGTLFLNAQTATQVTVACKTNIEELATQLSASLTVPIKSIASNSDLRITAKKAVVELGHELRLDAWIVEKDSNGVDTNWTRVSNFVTWSTTGFNDQNNSIASIVGEDGYYDYLNKPAGQLKAKEKGLIQVKATLGNKTATKWIESIDIQTLSKAYSFSFDLYSNLRPHNACLHGQTLDDATQTCIVDANSTSLFVAGAGKSVGGESADTSSFETNASYANTDLAKNNTKYFVDEEATKVFDEIRTHLCTINQTMYYHPDAIKAGTFKSLIDLNNCKKGTDFNDSIPFTVTVEPDKYTGSYPMTVEFWGYTQNESKTLERVTARMHVWEQPSESNVFGIFDMDMQIRKDDTTVPFYFESYYDTDMKPTITYVSPDKRARLVFSNDGQKAYGKVAYSNPTETVFYSNGTSKLLTHEVAYDIAFDNNYLIRKAFGSDSIEAFSLGTWDEIAQRYNLYYADSGKKAGLNNIKIEARKKTDESYKIYFSINDGVIISRTPAEYKELIVNLADYNFYEQVSNRPVALYLNKGIMTLDRINEGTMDELKYDFIPGRYFDNTIQASVDRFIYWIGGGFKLAKQIDDISYELVSAVDTDMSILKQFAASNIFGYNELSDYSYTFLGAYVTYSDVTTNSALSDVPLDYYFAERYIVITPAMSGTNDKIYYIDWSYYLDDYNQSSCEALNTSLTALAANGDGYKWDTANSKCVPATDVVLSANQEEYLDEPSCTSAGKTWNSLKNFCDVCEGNSDVFTVEKSTYAQYVYDVSAQVLRELKTDGSYGKCITTPNDGISDTEDVEWISLIDKQDRTHTYWFDPYSSSSTYAEVIYTDTNKNAGMADDTTFTYGDNNDSVSILGSNSKAVGIPMKITKKSTAEVVTDVTTVSDFTDLHFTQAYDIPNAQAVTSEFGLNYVVMQSQVFRKPHLLSQVPSDLSLKETAVTLPSFDAWIGEEPQDSLNNPLFVDGIISRSISNPKLLSVRGELLDGDMTKISSLNNSSTPVTPKKRTNTIFKGAVK